MGQRKWLTKDLARSETAPRYSPDGKRIAYFTNRSGAEREGIWVMDADGANTTQLIEDNRRTNVYPRWSPDGQDLIFYSRSGWGFEEPPDLRRICARRRRASSAVRCETLVSVIGDGATSAAMDGSASEVLSNAE